MPCKSATVPAAVILCESETYMPLYLFNMGRRFRGEISQKTCQNNHGIFTLSGVKASEVLRQCSCTLNKQENDVSQLILFGMHKHHLTASLPHSVIILLRAKRLLIY